MSSAFSRIYIVGSVASGKTTLARELSGKLGIPWYELDNVVWERRSGGDAKRQPHDRDRIFDSILTSEKWIIEDVLRPCFEKGLKRADLVILMDIPYRRRRWMAFFRWVKQLFHIERSSYKPTVDMLKSINGWNGDFERNRPAFLKRLEPYRAKLRVLKSRADVERLIQELTQ